MPSYTSIINALFRLMPSDKRVDALKSVAKLHPHSETLSDLALAGLQLDEHTRAWQTRHAVEACRGWKWPFWLNAQMNPASAAGLGTAIDQTLSNQCARDAAAVPGLPYSYAGTVDRRGMFTTAGGRFSVECWFRFGDRTVYPTEILSEDGISFEVMPDHISFSINSGTEHLQVIAAGRAIDDFKYVELKASCSPTRGAPLRPVTIYLSIRPYNLEGIAPLHDLVYNSKGFWMSENHVIGWFATRPSESWGGDARHGDAAFFMSHPPERTAIRCPAGLATAISAFHFPAEANGKREVTIVIPTEPTIPGAFPFVELVGRNAARAHGAMQQPPPLQQAITITAPLWNALLAAANQQLCSITDIRSKEMHGQFLHHNHWLVPAVRALLYQGHPEHAARLLQYPALSIQQNGYLGLGGGKWGFQGQFLTALADYFRLTQSPAGESILNYRQIRTVARWIMRKRREVAHAPAKPTGLLPPGVTRTGTGMEYQLADNFWGLQGLESAAWLARHFGEHTDAEILKRDVARYASQINSAIHRELEYGLSQQVPGRLHRAFDPSSAAELLDIALMPEARRHLRADDWLTRLIPRLIEPLPQSPTSLSSVTLRALDEHGVYPARRLMLCLAMLTTSHGEFPALLEETTRLATPMLSWPERLNIRTGMGTGKAMLDPEGTGLFTVLMRQLLVQETDQAIRLNPALPDVLLGDTLTFQLISSPTTHGLISATIACEEQQMSLDLHAAISDPTVEIQWCRPEPGKRTTYPCHTVGTLGAAMQASGSHTYKFPSPSNNPAS